MIRSTRLDLYDVDLHLVTRQRDLLRVLEDLPIEPSDRTVWNSMGQVQSYVFGELEKESAAFALVVCIDRSALLRDRDRDRLLKVTAHEATHAAALLLDYVGEPYDGVSEPLAYLVGWITTWLWREVRP